MKEFVLPQKLSRDELAETTVAEMGCEYLLKAVSGLEVDIQNGI
jgi:hypothetical protein